MPKARLIFEDDIFKLLKGRNYIVVRKNFPYEYHSHFERYNGAMLLMKLFYQKLKPREEYFIGAMLRITTEDERANFGEQKQKQMYFNVNKKGAKKHRRK